MRKHTSLFLIPVFALALLLAGCGVESSNPPPSPPPNAGFHANFYFSSSGYVLPFPTDLFFLGSADGTVNIQGLPQPNDYSNPLVAINTLDGFSTTAPITEQFSAQLDPSSLAGNVFVFSVVTDPSLGYAVVGVNGLLVPGTDYTLSLSDADPSVLEITPIGALDASSSYMIVLTDGIQDTDGNAAQASDQFMAIKEALAGGPPLTDPLLQQIAPLFGAMLTAAQQAAGIDPADVAMIWTVSTQSAGPVLATVASTAAPGSLAFQDLGHTTSYFNPALSGYAEVFVGTFTLPYYLGIPTPQDPSPALTDFWHGANGSILTRYNTDPVPTATVTIPVIMTIPAQGSPYFMQGGVYPPDGWPVVIFQHGITGDRVHSLAVADTFAQFGIATIAIDLPLHGVTDPANPFYQNQLVAGVASQLQTGERTFDLPKGLDTGTPEPGTIADSGAYFINLSYLLTSRDNLREAVADLLHLTVTLPTAQFMTVNNGQPTQEEFNTLRTYFTGLSLGAIVGIPYLAQVTKLPGYGSTIVMQSATLSEPGGKVAYLLKTSPTFGPIIEDGLAANGLTPGTLLYEQFFQWAQTAIDSGDPLNYAAAAAANTPINFTSVVGNEVNPPDQVVPVWTQELLWDAMDLTQYGQTTVDLSGIRGVVKYTAGVHASLINPEPFPLVTQQMQIEMAVFAAGCLPIVPGCPPTGGPPNGQTLDIAYPSVVQQP
ncbi:MAG: Ig-like domain-containing protein [Gammaproteobacteria bacterium]|nr:Ig-like domain-containing protein [Gammaproteobacteria bacterium]